MALVIAAIATHPQITLVVLAYTYLVSGLIGWRGDGWRSPRPERDRAAWRESDAVRGEPPQAGRSRGDAGPTPFTLE